jgi:hypothetical protein
MKRVLLLHLRPLPLPPLLLLSNPTPTPTPTLDEEWESLGCYRYLYFRTIPWCHGLTYLPATTSTAFVPWDMVVLPWAVLTQSCQAVCYNAGYAYAGTEYSAECCECKWCLLSPFSDGGILQSVIPRFAMVLDSALLLNVACPAKPMQLR